MDVNPFGRKNMSEETGEEAPRKSFFKRCGHRCVSCFPSSLKGWLVFLIIAAVIWRFLVGWGFLPSLTFPKTDGSKWQAVFLANGQVYFGHMKELNRSYAILKDVYYLRVSEQLQPPAQKPQTNVSLVKLGDEIHGPENIMNIPKNQIIFWENMRDDSAVVQAIQSVIEKK